MSAYPALSQKVVNESIFYANFDRFDESQFSKQLNDLSIKIAY